MLTATSMVMYGWNREEAVVKAGIIEVGELLSFKDNIQSLGCIMSVLIAVFLAFTRLGQM